MRYKKFLFILKNLKPTDIISLSGILLVTLFSIINLLTDQAQGSKLEKIEFQLSSIKFQPKLKIVDKPKIIKIWSDTSNILKDSRDLIVSESVNDTPTFEFPIQFNTAVNLKITNIGNSLGKILLIAYSDTTGDIDLLREKIKVDEAVRSSKQFPDFTESEILANAVDTIDLQFELPIQFVDKQLFTLHFLILYENELGNIYDTYYWSEYKIEDIIFPFGYRNENGKLVLLKNVVMTISIDELFKFKRSKSSYHTYKDKKTTDTIRKNIKQRIKYIEKVE